MTRLESILESGKMRCGCKKVELIIKKNEKRTAKIRSSDALTNLVQNTLLGVVYNKKKIVTYSAYCEQCSKLYLSYYLKKDLLKAISQLEEAGLCKLKGEKQ